MTTIKEWLRAAGRDLDQRFTTARDKLTHAHRVASEKVTPVAHRAAENVGSAYQAVDYVEAHLPKEDAGLPPVADARLPLAEPVEPSPVAKPKKAA